MYTLIINKKDVRYDDICNGHIPYDYVSDWHSCIDIDSEKLCALILTHEVMQRKDLDRYCNHPVYALMEILKSG